MSWTELSIEVPGEYAEPVSHLFSKHGEGAAVVELPGGYNPDEGESPVPNAPVIVRTYLPGDATTGSRRTMIDVGLKLIAYLCPLPELQVREVPDDEWKNQTFEPIQIGRRILISPSGTEANTRADDIVIPLEPGLAFGTGHHPTTAMVLSAMEDVDLNGANVLDAGSGSGILSIAAILMGASRAVGFDVEEDAVRSSGQNAERAGVSESFEVFHGSLPDARVPEGSFNFILANISANVLKLLSSELLTALKPDGAIIASGVLEERYSEVEETFRAAGGELFEKRAVEDWTSFKVRHA